MASNSEPGYQQALSTSPNAASDAVVDVPPENCFRLVVLGSARVGKSSLVARFLSNKFSDSYTPTIENFHRKIYRIRGEVYQLDILDTSGNHPFPAMRRLSFITGDLFLLVYSVDSRESFEEVMRLREQILETKLHSCNSGIAGGAKKSKKSNSGLFSPSESSVSLESVMQRANSKKRRTNTQHAQPIVAMAIAGNKCDKEMRTVSAEEVGNYCSVLAGCCQMDISAKKNWHVDDLFRQLFQMAMLPSEMAPNSHKRLLPGQAILSPMPPLRDVSAKSSRRFKGLPELSMRRRLSDAYGIVSPNARRPSLRTDLIIMKNKTNSRQDKKEKNCVLQ